ncbi:MAG: hypothetical protein C4519_20190 [Desulfobacteraceae bacterium]|nr:MAG: hypothetical protein C4519_20190 [Desulfobacteraceae bacterium]
MSESRTDRHFNADEIQIINQAVTMAEELVSNHFKMSASQWLRPKYDVKTLMDLSPEEQVDGPFAQIIRYEGQRKGSTLGSEVYDFYKICLQDPAILKALRSSRELTPLPFGLYIIIHELVHIVRFSKFLQNFHASRGEKLIEEHRVHEITRQILIPIRLPGVDAVIDYYHRWQLPIESLSDQ